MSIPDLLARHRAGEATATSALIEHFRKRLCEKYLTRALAQRKLLRYISRDDLTSQLYYDLTVAVDRLRRNAVEADDVEQFIRNELRHSVAHCLRHESDDILGTESGEVIARDRKRQGRVESDYDDIEDVWVYRRIDPIDDPLVCSDYPQRASRFEQKTPQQELIEAEMRHEQKIDYDACQRVAKTPLEKNVAAMFVAGLDIVAVAESLPGVSHTQIANIVSRLRERTA